MRCDALPAFHVAEIWDSSEIKNELCISVYLLVYSLYVYAYIYRCVYIPDSQRRDFRSKYPYIYNILYIVLIWAGTKLLCKFKLKNYKLCDYTPISHYRIIN